MKSSPLHQCGLLLALLLTTALCAAQPAQTPLQVVVLSAFDLHTTQNRIVPFQQLMADTLGRRVQVRPISNFQQVEKWADEGLADIVFLSANRGQQLAAQHGYQILTQTFQPVYLYVRRGQLNTPLNRFHMIGVVDNTLAKDIALQKIPALSPDATFTYLPHHTAALMALVQGKVDGIVCNPGAVTGIVDNIAQSVGARYSFDEVGSSVVAIAPQLAGSEFARQLQQLLLSNGPIIEQVFQQNFGLGPQMLPTSTRSMLRSHSNL